MNTLKKFIAALVILAFTSSVAMAYVTPGDLNRLRGLAMTFTSAVITTLTATSATLTTAAITTLTGVTATFTGVVTDTRTPAADSATTNKGVAVNLTAPVDTTGTNTHNAVDVGLTVSNATGGTNKVNAYNVGNVTGDAQVDVSGLRIGTGTTLGTSNGIVIGSGWDAGISDASGITTSGTLTTTGAISVDGVTVNNKQLTLPGRVDITICGDGTTINNNTIYYGPSMVPVANAIRTCDTTQVGNATEATADAPALDNTAIQVLSMDCLTADPGAAGVSFTLRNNAGATVPSVTCTTANTKLGCTANVQTTTAIAAGNPIAVAAASTGNQGSTPFACVIHAAY